MPSERLLRTIAGVLALAGIGVATYITVVDGPGGQRTLAVPTFDDLQGAIRAVG